MTGLSLFVGKHTVGDRYAHIHDAAGLQQGHEH